PEKLGIALKRLGVIGSMVWDTIYGRDPAQPAVQEWGGISYALAALDAALPDDWQIVALIKVGRDLAAKANEFLSGVRRTAHGARFIEVPQPNNRVTLRYESAERRCEQMAGGAPRLFGSGTSMKRARSEEHTSELQSRSDLVSRRLLEKIL